MTCQVCTDAVKNWTIEEGLGEIKILYTVLKDQIVS